MTAETGLPGKVVDALRRGDKIGAIKLLREQTGIGLKEAKDAVEAAGIEAPAKSPGEVRGSGAPWRWIILAALAVMVVYTFLPS